jgi:hypothetical protein
LLWRNEDGDWTVEVDGSRYEHLSPAAVHLFVRRALMYAETSRITCQGSVWALQCFVSEMEPNMEFATLAGQIGLSDDEGAVQ